MRFVVNIETKMKKLTFLKARGVHIRHRQIVLYASSVATQLKWSQMSTEKMKLQFLPQILLQY
jgi:hypothetical protein